jgi:hypothetical protein
MLTDSRRLPSDQLLEELRDFYFFSPFPTGDPQLVAKAWGLLAGEMDSLGYPGEKIGMPFDAKDIDRLSGGGRILLAKFAVPRLLLAAYQATGSEEFIAMARDVLVGWALHERSSWLPRGLLWLDTTVAERMLVLAEFWRLYRHHPAFDPDVAKIILELAARSSRLLAKPAQYTFSSNHGVMQNLALWHFCLAFPALPNVEQYKQLVFDRMHDQLALYINDEGVVLEHSAGYQEVGLRFIGMAFRYASLLNLPIPEDWAQKYDRAKNFYAHLRRPDGSLPVFGDTRAAPARRELPMAAADGQDEGEGWQDEANRKPWRANSLYPVAGYSVWWSGLAFWPQAERMAQTVVAWSHFHGHSHKHADEMSVLLWAGGQTWWTNVGYWPYGPGRSEAIAWNGSSAPHLQNEDARSRRTTFLRSFGWSDQMAMLDLERNGPQRARIRRQLVYVEPHLWLVLDHFSGPGYARTTWTTAHSVNLSPGEIAGSYQLRAKDIDAELTTFVLGSEGSQVKTMRGSLKPFAGWEVVGSKPTPASALVIEQPADNSWSAVVWSWDDGVSPTRQFEHLPYMAAWKDAEHWRIALPIKPGLLEIRREETKLSAQHSNEVGNGIALQLTQAQDITREISQLRKSYAIASDKYPQFRVNVPSRLKATKFLVGFFVLQEILLFAYRRAIEKGYVLIRLCNLIGWIAVGVWLNVVKFGI